MSSSGFGRPTHRIALACVHIAVLLTTTTVVLVGRSDLRAQVATHFTLSGRPDATMERNIFCWVVLNAAVLITLLGLVTAWRVRGRSVLSSWSASLAFAGAMLAGFVTWTVGTQRVGGNAPPATGPSILAIALIVGSALTCAALASTLALRGTDEWLSSAVLPRLGLGDQESATWTRRLRSPWFLLFAGIGVVFAIVGLFVGLIPLVVVGLVTAIVNVEAHTIRVRVDRLGLRIAWGPFGVPATRITLDRIATASPIDVKPREWGGWGYRGSLRFWGRAAAVLRRGPGIRVDLRDGRTFAVTIDDADTAAALLNDYVARVA